MRVLRALEEEAVAQCEEERAERDGVGGRRRAAGGRGSEWKRKSSQRKKK